MPQHQPQRSYTLGGGGYEDTNTYGAYGTNAYPANDTAATGYQNPHDNYAYGAGGQSTAQYGATLAPYNDPLQRPDSTATSASFYSQPSTQQHQPQTSNVASANQTSPVLPTAVPTGSSIAAPAGPRGPRDASTRLPSMEENIYEDSPPGYEAGPSQPVGVWSEKR